MAILGQVGQRKAVFQKDDKPLQEMKAGKTQLPDSWKLTKQQQEFIDMFSADDHKKQ
ncbi:hypothetical protein MUA02_19580 [Enterobacteriaceae bacterium H20N1]|uniref:Uncharacterized protein n=1 Tax=Dryocola boscaweniae TaxID=2925397 RepID=A0A9X2WB68_9ENTR|nr:hypothetical protein [Dryocola boscaweniae]MCT4704057.1 hypothetical protein [Dryocola boscaweniae]MCT4721225.1 hypothetical protein [Dryocola boscaweniae]